MVDSENTSGFFPDQDDGVVAIYTVHTPEAETQHIAYSRDGGYSFTKYANNPVIPSNSTEFRDPQVVWHDEIQKWVMAIAWAEDHVIAFYTSPDLKDWAHASNFTQPAMPGKQFECPNLVRFNVGDCGEKKDVLFISINPGAPLGGSGTGYLVGHFNGSHFMEEDQFRLIDFAKDNYAAQWFTNMPEDHDPVSIAWASNWQYTEEVPTGPLGGFRGADALPRVNTLQKFDGDWKVTGVPYNDLSTIRGPVLADKSIHSEDVHVDFSSVESNAVTFDVQVSRGIHPQATGEVTFNFTSSTSIDFLDGGIYLDSREFWINRGGTRGFTTADNPAFTPTFNTTVSRSPAGPFVFSGVIDRSLLEVFLNGGEQSATASFFPTAPLDELTISAKSLGGEAVVDVKVWGLESGWARD